MRQRSWLAATLALFLGSSAWADAEYDALLAEFQQAQQTWFKLLNEASEAQTDKSKPLDISKLPPRPEGDFKPRFKAYAAKHAGKADAIPALVWMLQAGASGGEPDADAREALEALTKSHAADERMADELEQLRYFSWQMGREPMVALFEKIARENKSPKAIAWAEFNTAFALYNDSMGDKPGADRSADKKLAGELFRKVAKAHGDRDAGKAANGYVYELDNLQIGMKAPDFEGEDADGRKIRLSDFRGKVVMIDFWGFW